MYVEGEPKIMPKTCTYMGLFDNGFFIRSAESAGDMSVCDLLDVMTQASESPHGTPSTAHACFATNELTHNTK